MVPEQPGHVTGRTWTGWTHPRPQKQQQSNAAAHKALSGDAMIGHSSQVCNVAIMLSRYQSDNPSSRTEEDCPVYDVPDHAQPMCSGINTCCRPLAGGLHLALWYQIPVSLSCGSNVTGITQQRTVRFLLNCDIRRYITHAAGGTPRSPPAPGQSSALRQGGGGVRRREGEGVSRSDGGRQRK